MIKTLWIVDIYTALHSFVHFLWIINTKLEIYQDSRANRATFVWSNWSENSPVETISTKINVKWNENKKLN